MRSAAVALAGVLILTACGGTAPEPAKTSPTPTRTAPLLGTAVQDCQKQAQSDYSNDPKDTTLVNELADMATSISLDTGSGGNASLTGVACILGGISAPSHVQTHIDTTRALDGMQEDEWDGFTARWSYHPDNGLNLTIVQVD